MTDYTRFYGFSENPFDLAPDAKFFFPSETHRETLAALSYGITERKGFILILGEAGIGKTTLINHLRNTSCDKIKFIFFPQGGITSGELLKEILLQLELPPRGEIKGTMLHELYHYLIGSLERDDNVVAIIDEAQDISLEVIEELRLLSNLETSKSKLLQIVLVGKPELNEKLSAEVIRQIRQRIVVNCGIRPLTGEESRQYIDHRLKIAGGSGSDVFTDDALALICRRAKGIPRTINILCSNALSVGFGLSEKKISAAIVKKVFNEKDIFTPEMSQKLTLGIKRNLPRKISYAFLALAVLAAMTLFGKDYALRLIDTEKPVHISEQSLLKAKAVTSIPVRSEIPKTPVAKPTATSTPKTEIRMKKIIEVTKGTNLSLLAIKYYTEANSTLLYHILEFNPEVTDPNLILVNQKIKIPEITEALLIKQSSDGTCKVHLGTFSLHGKASRYADDIALAGKKIEVIPEKVSPKETWYKVLAGPFASREEASKVLENLKQKDFLPSFRSAKK